MVSRPASDTKYLQLVDQELADNVLIVVPVPEVSMIIFGYLDKIGLQSMKNMLSTIKEFNNIFYWNSNTVGRIGGPRLESCNGMTYNWRNKCHLNRKNRRGSIFNNNSYPVAPLPLNN